MRTDRRMLLAGTLALGTIPNRAAACSVWVRENRQAQIDADAVRALFSSWWEGDRQRFEALLTERRAYDGTLMQSGLKASPDDFAHAMSLFDQPVFHPRGRKVETLLIDTAAGILFGCETGGTERDGLDEVLGDDMCRGMPEFHLFLVTLWGPNPRTISVIRSLPTVSAQRVIVYPRVA